MAPAAENARHGEKRDGDSREPVRRVEMIPIMHPVVAPEPKTPSPVRQPEKEPIREKEPA
jgi:hypothetical protein